jgi:hypothetical protein
MFICSFDAPEAINMTFSHVGVDNVDNPAQVAHFEPAYKMCVSKVWIAHFDLEYQCNYRSSFGEDALKVPE